MFPFDGRLRTFASAFAFAIASRHLHPGPVSGVPFVNFPIGLVRGGLCILWGNIRGNHGKACGDAQGPRMWRVIGREELGPRDGKSLGVNDLRGTRRREGGGGGTRSISGPRFGRRGRGGKNCGRATRQRQYMTRDRASSYPQSQYGENRQLRAELDQARQGPQRRGRPGVGRTAHRASAGATDRRARKPTPAPFPASATGPGDAAVIVRVTSTSRK